MAIIPNYAKQSKRIISYKFMVCVGRDGDNKQVWRTKTVKRPDDLTDKQLESKKWQKELLTQYEEWAESKKREYNGDPLSVDLDKLTFADFIRVHWLPYFVHDGSHKPKSVEFYEYTAQNLIDYFGDSLKLRQVNLARVKAYIKYLNTEAKVKNTILEQLKDYTITEDGNGGAELNWGKQDGDLSYTVYRRGTKEKYAKKLSEVSSPQFHDPEYDSVKPCKYIVKRRIVQIGEPYSKTTIKHNFNTLRNVLEYAARLHYIDADPCKDLGVKEKPRAKKTEIDFLPSRMAYRFIEALDTEPLFWRTYFNIVLTTGLRRGEALALQWRDIDYDNMTIHVERNVTRDGTSEDHRHIGETKAEDKATVPMVPRVSKMLEDLKTEQEEKYGVTFLPSSTAFIFCAANDVNTTVYPSEPTRMLSKITKRHGLPDLSPHDLRHSAATLALEAGANLKQVQTLLRHKDPATTLQYYAGVSEEIQRQTVQGIEDLITKKTIAK